MWVYIALVGSIGRGEGQACCDWYSDKLFDVGLHRSTCPPSLYLPPFQFVPTAPHLHFSASYCKLIAFDDFSASFFFFFLFFWPSPRTNLLVASSPAVMRGAPGVDGGGNFIKAPIQRVVFNISRHKYKLDRAGTHCFLHHQRIRLRAANLFELQMR